MSLSRKSLRRPIEQRRAESGFTLIEVVVALGLLAIVISALVPQIVVGVRASAAARDISQAKGVAQGRLELMRNMPFFVGRSAGPFIDMLDTYYTDLTPPTTAATCLTGSRVNLPAPNWSGYVTSTVTGNARCEYEPRTGAFFRRVETINQPGLGTFRLIVNTQFVTGNTPPTPVTPQTGYTSQVAGQDTPAAFQVAVHATVIYRTQSGFKWTTTYSQINNSSAADPKIVAQAKSTVVRAASTIDAATSPTNLIAEVGSVTLNGELYAGSVAAANATAGNATLSSGATVTSVALNRVGPPDQAPANAANAGSSNLSGLFCQYACFGPAQVANVGAAAGNGTPSTGTRTAPVESIIAQNAATDGFRFNNNPQGTRQYLDAVTPMINLDTSQVGSASVVDCVHSTSGTGRALHATGFVETSGDGPTRNVTTCATAAVGTVRLFPVNSLLYSVPGGIVQIRVNSATVRCEVSRVGGVAQTPTATAQYSAELRYWNGSAYTSWVPIRHTNTTDPLAAINLGASVGGGLTLGDYIGSWSSLTTASTDQVRRITPNSASMQLPGIINIDTKPTREGVTLADAIPPFFGDPASVINLSVGALSCSASDAR